jgi:BirA family biotin operon repressor/biotin-[acetyl-CoA-carboxylase] ligase
MAVWKHLKALRDLGVDFAVQRGKGYCLAAPLELLERDRILSVATDMTAAAIDDIAVFLELDSTNDWLREQTLKGAPSGTVCVAERQVAGRGRRGRSWISPFAANLYLSLLWRSASGAAALGGLSLVVGIALLRSLRGLGIHDAGLKWPNDILARDAKLAGILIDVVGEASGPCAVIVGIGVNVCMPRAEAAAIDQSWTDLYHLTGDRHISRNRLAAAILDEMLPAIESFENRGLQPFLKEYRHYDMTNGRTVDLMLPNENISGTACGIDAGGALLVETVTGRRRFVSGDVSLRVAAP